MDDSPSLDFAAIVHGLRLAVFVFHRTRILYQNEAAATCARDCRRSIRRT